MGRVLVLEAQPELRDLLSLVVRRAGHEPVYDDRGGADELQPLAAVIVEPASDRLLALAAGLRAASDELPVICVSVLPPTPASRSLAPFEHFVKPFRIGELESTLRGAVPSAAG